MSSGLSRLSEEIIQTSQQMKEKRLRSETAQKTREETEVRKANERIATTTALTVVQQEHETQKVRQEEHDVDHMTKQRKDQIIQDFSVRPKSRGEATGAARSEQPREQKTFHKASRRENSRAATGRGAGRACCGYSTGTGGAQDSTATGSTRHADRSINSSMSASRGAR